MNAPPIESGSPLREAAMRLIFPGLIVTEVVSSQPWWIGSFQPGQALGWASIAAFGVIIFTTPHLGRGARLLVAFIFLGKLGAWLTGVAALDVLYRVGLIGSVAMSGMVIAVERMAVVRRQAAILMIACAPLMALQVLGAGAWTQALTTHGTQADGESVSKLPAPALFVDALDLRVNNVQMRPAGFLHSSQFASLIIIFAFVITLTSPGRRRKLAEFFIVGAAVLSMAKIVLAAGAIAILWVLTVGSPLMRKRARAYALWMALLIAAYRVLLPGMFEANLAFESFALSLLSRAYDVAATLGYGALVDRQLYEVFHQRVVFAEEESLSGIGQLFRYLPYVLTVIAVSIPLGIIAFRRVTLRSITAFQVASTMVLSVALFLVAGPFIASPMYWFCFAFGLFPLLTVVDPGYLRNVVGGPPPPTLAIQPSP